MESDPTPQATPSPPHQSSVICGVIAQGIHVLTSVVGGTGHADEALQIQQTTAQLRTINFLTQRLSSVTHADTQGGSLEEHSWLCLVLLAKSILQGQDSPRTKWNLKSL